MTLAASSAGGRWFCRWPLVLQVAASSAGGRWFCRWPLVLQVAVDSGRADVGRRCWPSWSLWKVWNEFQTFSVYAHVAQAVAVSRVWWFVGVVLGVDFC